MIVKCSKCECKHNKNECCLAKKVKIAKDLDCKTYEKCENCQKEQCKKDLFEIGEEVKPTISKCNCIKCDAKCIFNNSGCCQANGITIKGNCPCCASQVDK